MTGRIADKIREADLVLVGIGEELEQVKLIRKSEKYSYLENRMEKRWILPFVEKIMLEELKKEKISIYQELYNILNKKNYFIVSTCLDGFIGYGGFDAERVVEPCGGYSALQCSECCSTELYDIPAEFFNQVMEYIDGKRDEEELIQPVCPICGKPLLFNNINAENYNEEGYLAKWMFYKKWLQGTVNKNLCILELGVGMKYPSVIRWPFEKVTFFNQKAELFRVHSWLYQISEEIKGRGHGICKNPEEFIRELSNAF